MDSWRGDTQRACFSYIPIHMMFINAQYIQSHALQHLSLFMNGLFLLSLYVLIPTLCHTGSVKARNP